MNTIKKGNLTLESTNKIINFGINLISTATNERIKTVKKEVVFGNKLIEIKTKNITFRFIENKTAGGFILFAKDITEVKNTFRLKNIEEEKKNIIDQFYFYNVKNDIFYSSDHFSDFTHKNKDKILKNKVLMNDLLNLCYILDFENKKNINEFRDLTYLNIYKKLNKKEA